jgi:hypothetical protein
MIVRTMATAASATATSLEMGKFGKHGKAGGWITVSQLSSRASSFM